MYVIGFCLVLVAIASGQREGESCVDTNANTVGICTRAYRCQSAKRDYQLNGIQPTFCSRTSPLSPNTLLCCRDKTNFLQTPKPQKPRPTTGRPVWGAPKRVSERKCEEYTRGVVQTVEFFALLPDADTLSVTTAKCDYNSIGLIYDGTNAELGEFPHMTAIGWVGLDEEYVFLCGGSLISHNFVLTAAHCTNNTDRRLSKHEAPVIVKLGDLNIDDSVQDGASPIDVQIRRMYVHPEYRPPWKYNDIALLELSSDVAFKAHIRAACLWTKPTFTGYDKVIATGWGVTETREPSKDLKKVTLDILDNNLCDSRLEHNPTKWTGFYRQMCAGVLQGRKDTCQGDSGAPIQVVSKGNQCIFYVLGVTAFGKKCGNAMGIYTRVPDYLDWIEPIVWPGE